MSTRRYGQRLFDRQRWLSFYYLCDCDDLIIEIKRTTPDGKPILTAEEVNAACNATVILARMVRKGRTEIARRGTIDPGSKGP